MSCPTHVSLANYEPFIGDKQMFDLGIFTLPLIGAISVFSVALFLGEDIVIEKIEVTHQMEWNGYGSDVVTRQLADELREVSHNAASELTGVEVDESQLEKGVASFEDYFELSVLINGARNLFGLIPYYVDGEITEKRGEATFVARVFTQVDDEMVVEVVTVTGDTSDLRALMQEAAVGILERVNPYILALHYRKQEAAAKQFDFPKTKAVLDHYLEERPVDTHYLAYALLGRMHMIKAESDTALSPEEKQAEYETSIKFLHAALMQRPDFLYPLINLGLIHGSRGEIEVAEQYFARAVVVNPNYLITRTSWGDMLAKQGRLQEAAIQYVAAVEIGRENAHLRDMLAKIYVGLGQYDAAREQWEEALYLSPTTLAYAESIRGIEKSKDASPGAGSSSGEATGAVSADDDASLGEGECTRPGSAPGC